MVTADSKTALTDARDSLIGDFALAPLDTFEFTVDTTKTSAGSTASDAFKLPLMSTGAYNFLVDWGDASTDTITAWDQAETTHTYSSSGVYTIKITGCIAGWRFNNTGDRLKLLSVADWGPLVINDDRAFFGCGSLTTATAGVLQISSSTLANMFDNCSSLTSIDVTGWSISGVGNLGCFFDDCSSLTSVTGIPTWDTSLVTSEIEFFKGCSSLVSVDVTGLVGPTVTTIANMFNLCTVLTTITGHDGWDTSGVTGGGFTSLFFGANAIVTLDLSGWDVSGATSMDFMFRSATSLTSIGDVSGWDTSSVTSMNAMFRFCNVLASVALSGWDVSSVANFTDFFNPGGLGTPSYDALLIAWDALDLVDSLTIDFDSTKYSSGAAATARASIIATDLWTILDGGPV